MEYRLPVLQQRIGVGALVDAALGDYPHTIVGGMATARPIGAVSGLKLIVAPALEFVEGHQAFLLRSGIGYDIHAGAFSVSPMFNLDFVDGHVGEVYGIAFGVSF